MGAPPRRTVSRSSRRGFRGAIQDSGRRRTPRSRVGEPTPDEHFRRLFGPHRDEEVRSMPTRRPPRRRRRNARRRRQEIVAVDPADSRSSSGAPGRWIRGQPSSPGSRGQTAARRMRSRGSSERPAQLPRLGHQGKRERPLRGRRRSAARLGAHNSPRRSEGRCGMQSTGLAGPSSGSGASIGGAQELLLLPWSGHGRAGDMIAERSVVRAGWGGSRSRVRLAERPSCSRGAPSADGD